MNPTQTPTATSGPYGTLATMTGHAAPRPPRELEIAMGEAGLAGDTTRLAALKAEYELWALSTHGYWPNHAIGSTVPDEVWE